MLLDSGRLTAINPRQMGYTHVANLLISWNYLPTHLFFFILLDEDTDQENEEDMETERVEEEIIFMDVAEMEEIQDMF